MNKKTNFPKTQKFSVIKRWATPKAFVAIFVAIVTVGAIASVQSGIVSTPEIAEFLGFVKSDKPTNHPETSDRNSQSSSEIDRADIGTGSEMLVETTSGEVGVAAYTPSAQEPSRVDLLPSPVAGTDQLELRRSLEPTKNSSRPDVMPQPVEVATAAPVQAVPQVVADVEEALSAKLTGSGAIPFTSGVTTIAQPGQTPDTRPIKIHEPSKEPLNVKPKEDKLTRAKQSFDGDLKNLRSEPQTERGRHLKERVIPAPRSVNSTIDEKPSETEEEPPSSLTPGRPLAAAPAPLITFDGLGRTGGWGNGYPPDPSGDVGPNHYIQAINTALAIYNKADGSLAAGPFSFNAFMSLGNFGNQCDTNNFGDPIVLYDTFEDRWIVTDFAFTLDVNSAVVPPVAFQCFAVSKTADPVSGGWNYYSIQRNDGLNDYPKFGVWSDGLYMSANMFGFASGGTYQGTTVWALNKAQMYAGAPTVQIVSFDIGSGDFALLPSNARLQTGTPSPGTPNFFTSSWNFLNGLTVYKFSVSWNKISLSTFTGPDVPLAATSWPNAAVANVPQSGTAQLLDTLNIRAMMQNQYTKIGGAESLWMPHTIRRANTTGAAAPRWYQVNVTGGTVAANLPQAATWDPDGDNTTHRFMPSLSVDRGGNLALAYTASGSTIFPSIRYAGRLASDPINTFSQTEQTLFAGAGSQTNTNRWGDYTHMTLDPDGCTFWYTNEYYQASGSTYFTRIGSFKYPECTAVGAGGTVSGVVTTNPGGTPIVGATVDLGARTTTTNGSGAYSFTGLPAGTYSNITASASGYVSASASSIAVTDGGTTTQNFSLLSSPVTGCLTDTTQADFQNGVGTSVDFLSTPGSVTLSNALGESNTAGTTTGTSINADTLFSGQTFIPALSGQLARVDVQLFCNGCTGTTPNITVSVRATAAGLPTGADLATATIPGFSNPASTYYTATFGAPATLTAGTQYALIVRPTANPSVGGYFWIRSSPSTYANGQRVLSGNSGATWTADATRDFNFRMYLQNAFGASGDLVSGLKDANPSPGFIPNWSTLGWNATVPGSTTLRFQVAASNSPFGPFNFVGPDTTAGTFFTTTGASLAQFNGLRYLKYKAYLTTSNSAVTPTLQDVEVCFTNILPSADLSITKTDGVTTAIPGGSVTYTITASNAGPGSVTGATVADTLPASLTATWTCVGAGGGTCTAAGSGNINDSVNLPSGASVTYTVSAAISSTATGTLVNTATVSSAVTDSVPGNNSATDTDTLTPQTDLAITKTDGVASAVPGGSVTYTITASNAGPSSAPGSTVADTLPASLTATWTCVGAGGGTCTAAGSGNINDTVNLPSGGSVTYTVSASISASATGTLSNTATVSSSVTDPNPGNNSATDTDTLTPQANLGITKTDGVASAVPGGSVTYTITASNAGPSNAPGSTVADTFPASLTGTWTCAGAGGGTCTAAGAGNINDTVNLPAGGSVTYTVTATISASATGTLSNTATVTAAGGVTDAVPGNNSATDTDTLTPQANLSITKTDGVSAAVPGATVTYTITAANAGPSNAPGANVTDTFPAAITGVSWTCTGSGGGTCTAAGSNSINDTVNLPSGGSVTYTAVASISPTAQTTLSNTATVTAPGGVTDSNLANNSATDTDTLPTCIPVSATYVDDNWVGTPIGSDPDGGGPALQFGCDSFATVQGGVTGVLSGGSVTVFAGTYAEAQVLITKAVTVTGAGFGSTTINGGNSANVSAGTVRIDLPAGVTGNVSFSGFTITNPGVTGSNRYHAFAKQLETTATITLSNNRMLGTVGGSPADYALYIYQNRGPVVFNNNQLVNNTSNAILVENPIGAAASTNIHSNSINGNAFSAIFAMAYSGNDVTALQRIANNTFDGSGASAISINGGFGGSTGKYTNLQITGNTINALGGATARTGISLNNGASAGNQALGAIENPVVTGNTILGTNAAASYGVRTRGLVISPTISGNNIRNLTAGIWGEVLATGSATGAQAHLNNIVNNTEGIRWDAVSGMDAENNWWGCNAGPGAAGCNPIAGTNAAGVDRDPWIVLGVGAVPSTILAGTSSAITADMTRNSSTGTPVGTIPNLPVAFTATQGTMAPTSGTITAGLANSTFTSTNANNGSACATVDNQLTCTPITVIGQTSTTLVSLANPSVFGQSVTFRATVVTVPAGGTPNGTVNFKDAGVSIPGCAAVNVVAGIADCVISTLAIGNHTISAEYSGSTTTLPSSANMTGNPQVVGKANTTTTITSDNNDPSVFGETVVVNYTVAVNAPGAGTATGNVVITVSGGAETCTGTVATGTCSLPLVNLGGRTITATYAGNTNFNGSLDTESHTVNKALTSTALTAAPNPTTYGDNLDLTATLTAVLPGTGIPQGTVNFLDGGNPIPDCQSIGLNASGVATCSVNSLGAGVNKTLSAVYSGNATYNTSTGTATQTVNKRALTVTSDPKTKVYGEANPSLTATITGFVLGQDLGTSGVTGAASLSTTATVASPVGSYPITAAIGTLAAANYSFTFVAGTLEVTKAVLTVTADAKARVYGAADPVFTATITGFVLGQNLGTSGVTGSPVFSTNPVVTAASAPGDYAIVPALGTLASANYSFTFVNGNLAISKAATTTTITNAGTLGNVSGVGQAYGVNWTTVPVAPGAGVVTGNVTVSDGTGATCTAAVAAGTCQLVSLTPGVKTITATYAGDANFTGSTSQGVAHTVLILIAGNVKQFVANGVNTNLAGVTLNLTGSAVSQTTTGADGNYVFGVPTAGGSYVVTPSGLGKVFEPISRTYTNLNTSIANADFIAYDNPGPNSLARQVQVVNTAAVPGQSVTVPLEITSQGNEQSISLSLGYDIALLGIPAAVTCGSEAVNCTVTLNNNNAGRVGITFTNPVPMTTGTREFARITFPGSNNTAASTQLSFDDQPFVRTVRNAAGDPLPSLYRNGFVTFGQNAGGLEGDVVDSSGSPAGGDGVLANDVSVIRQFVLGLATPSANGNQFQRADMGPRDPSTGTYGDGAINASDITIVRLYALGLLPPTNAAGPTVPVNTGTEETGRPETGDRSEDTPVIRVRNSTGAPGTQVSIPVDIDATGAESSLSFTLNWNPQVLTYVSASLGSGAPTSSNLGTNIQQTATGKLGVLIDSINPFEQGTKQVLTVTFQVPPNAPRGSFPLIFTGSPTSQSVSTNLGSLIPASYETGYFITAEDTPEYFFSTISGKVLTPEGAGLRNAIVKLTAPDGTARTATTSSFGIYQFDNVPNAQTYTLTVTSKRFRFSPRQLSVSTNLTGVDLIGLQ